jgi:hypothetical protein
MKANELRIGNFFYPDVDGDAYAKITAKDILELYSDPIDDYYKALPLTEEWLIKFGFERKGITSCFGKLCIHHKEPMYPYGRVYFNSWAILQKMPEYVHQIQNLYFALTGEELEVQNGI